MKIYKPKTVIVLSDDDFKPGIKKSHTSLDLSLNDFKIPKKFLTDDSCEIQFQTSWGGGGKLMKRVKYFEA